MSSSFIKAARFDSFRINRGVIFWSSLWFICALIVLSRRPDSILHAQFWSEDGRVWYADAYNIGAWKALLIPHTGYLQTIPRLTAAASLLIPLSLAPLFFNMVAIVFQITPVVFLLSTRFDTLIPSVGKRFMVSFLYLSMPNVWEIDANITNAQWHAALIMFMILIADRPSTILWKVFDFSILLLGGLTGPFILVLFPISIIYGRFRRTTTAQTKTLILGTLFLVQLFFVLTSAGTARFHGQLGMSMQNLLSILSGQVVISSTLGIKVYFLMYHFWWANLFVPLAFFLLGVSLMMVALFTGPIELKLFLLYSWAMLMAALVSPAPGTSGQFDIPAWQAMAIPNGSLRYFFFPTLSWLIALVWLMSASTRRFFKTLARIFLIFTVAVAIPTSWGDPNLIDMHFQRYVAEFNHVPVGTIFDFPQNPPDWTAPMTLIKK